MISKEVFLIRFCPHCGTTLIQKMDGGHLRPTCPMGDYIHYAHTPVSIGALVIHNDAVLLIRSHKGNGFWSMPGGYLE